MERPDRRLKFVSRVQKEQAFEYSPAIEKTLKNLTVEKYLKGGHLESKRIFPDGNRRSGSTPSPFVQESSATFFSSRQR